MLMVRVANDFVRQMMGEPVDSKKGLKKIQDAGIDTNSKAYQVVNSEGNFIDPAIKYVAKSNGKIYNKIKLQIRRIFCYNVEKFFRW